MILQLQYRREGSVEWIDLGPASPVGTLLTAVLSGEYQFRVLASPDIVQIGVIDLTAHSVALEWTNG